MKSNHYWPCDHSLSLLVVDDDPVDSGLLKRQLMAINSEFAVRTVDSGQNALKTHGDFTADCVFLDYHMAGGNADRFIAELSAQDDTVPIIIVTGAEEVGIVSTVLALGATDVLFKDSLTIDLLKDAINKALLRINLRAGQGVEAAADSLSR